MRIVIVEDELRIRQGLAKLIRKINPTYQIVGEAEDGAEGVRVITESRPDLVITDVRMADIDGLEMLSRVGESSTRVRAIVLSAYSDFSYACQAIKLGVSEYLLKPINVCELTRSLKNIEDQISSEKRARQHEDGYSLERMLYSIILGGMVLDADLHVLLARDFHVDAEGVFASVTMYLGSRYEIAGKRLAKWADANMAKRSGFEYRILDMPRTRRIVIVVLNIKDVESTRTWFAGTFMSRLKEMGEKDVCVGWGCFRDLSTLKNGLQQVDGSLDWNIVLGGDDLIVWPDVNGTPVAPMSYPNMIESQVRSSLCCFQKDRYESGIREFLDYFHADNVYSPREIKNAFIRFFWSVFNTAREVEYEKYASLSQQEIFEQITFAITWRELAATANVLLKLFPQKEESISSEGSVVRRAKNVVHEFYSQGISLNEVALKINVTAEYLSAQFHRETGKTFSAYIRDYRIRRAKELLIGTDLKLHKVGEKVGYSDSKYFCRVFREVTGLNPSNYRQINR